LHNTLEYFIQYEEYRIINDMTSLTKAMIQKTNQEKYD
jgi:hypothetical protein